MQTIPKHARDMVNIDTTRRGKKETLCVRRDLRVGLAEKKDIVRSWLLSQWLAEPH